MNIKNLAMWALLLTASTNVNAVLIEHSVGIDLNQSMIVSSGFSVDSQALTFI